MKIHSPNVPVDKHRAGHGHGNKTSWPHRSDSDRWPELSLRKVPADSVPHGTSISRNGKHVWAAYDSETLVAVAATADEARRKARRVLALRPQRAEGDR